jgi:DNA-binding transcriptional MerR regulator
VSAAVAEVEPLYNLKAVVQKTGIPAASLRAWERRYGILCPVRKPNGHRVYPASEVEKLLQIKALLAQGLTISQAVEQVRLGTAPAVAQSEVERLRTELGAALRRWDVRRANQVVAEALDLYPVEQVVLKVIRPLLPGLTPFGRTYLRSRLGAMLLACAAASGPTAVVMCPDLLDLRPLMVAILLSRRGRQVIYVEGTELPEGLQPDLIIDPRRWRGGVPPEQLFE